MCRNSVKWLYRADESFSWESGLEIDEDMVFRDASGGVRLFGWLVYGAKKAKRSWRGSGSPVGDLA